MKVVASKMRENDVHRRCMNARLSRKRKRERVAALPLGLCGPLYFDKYSDESFRAMSW